MINGPLIAERLKSGERVGEGETELKYSVFFEAADTKLQSGKHGFSRFFPTSKL